MRCCKGAGSGWGFPGFSFLIHSRCALYAIGAHQTHSRAIVYKAQHEWIKKEECQALENVNKNHD